jgi:uncharacterized membrane protein YfcA
MLDTNILLIASFIILIASVVKGLTGFGFALTSLPLLTLFLTPKTAVPLIVVCSVFLDGYTFYETRRFVQYKEIFPLVVSGILGMILGTYFLVSLNSDIIRVAIGIVTILFAVASIMGIKREISNIKMVSIPIGLVSGVLGGLMSISGPPIVLFFINQNIEKRMFRANLLAYFFSLYLTTVPAYFFGNLLTLEMLGSAIIMVPIMFLGATVGIRASKRVDENFFKKITLLMVLFTGIMIILNALEIL